MSKPSGKFNVEKLKVNCKLAIKRIQVLQQKKAECLKRERKKIADLIASDKIDTARIKVEQLIREDYVAEALEIVENNCETVLSRLALILSQKNVDEGLTPIIASIVWATPRLSYDIAELKNISDQFYHKFGKAFHEAASSNSLKIVNERIVSCLSVQPPESNLVEYYLKTIADAHNLPYEPKIVEFNDKMNKIESELVDCYLSSHSQLNESPPVFTHNKSYQSTSNRSSSPDATKYACAKESCRNKIDTYLSDLSHVNFDSSLDNSALLELQDSTFSNSASSYAGISNREELKSLNPFEHMTNSSSPNVLEYSLLNDSDREGSQGSRLIFDEVESISNTSFDEFLTPFSNAVPPIKGQQDNKTCSYCLQKRDNLK